MKRVWRAWTAQEDAILIEALARGDQRPELSRLTGRGAAACGDRARRLGLSVPRPTWAKDQTAKLRELAAQGLTAKQLGEALGVSKGAICGMCYRAKIPLTSGDTGRAGRRKGIAAVKQNAVAARRREAKAKPGKPGTYTREGAARISDNAMARFKAAASLAIAPRHWETRGYAECVFPLDVNGETHSCCNATMGERYCSLHAQVVFKPAPALARAA